jgi:hypothetical protein
MQAAFALFCDAPWQGIGGAMTPFVRTNIDRVQLEASARLLGVELTPSVFADVRVCEGEAIRYWSRKR